MFRVLFVSNGHGEISIADRIAPELRALVPSVEIDHLALVGVTASETMREVGPRLAMPSGGLIAMGNVRNIAADLRAGLLGLTYAQNRFLRSCRGRYDAIVAVGDVYALLMARTGRAPAIFVGTAKSVNVTPYGRLEERALRGAAAVFVRDEATAQRLRAHGLRVEPAANVIVDLFAGGSDPKAASALEGFAPALALFPGSRESAYDHAALLLEVTRALAERDDSIGAVLSIARDLDAERFAAIARGGGWGVAPNADPSIPFALTLGGRARVRAWRGPLGPLLGSVALVLGQAGTANEAAAAAGIPVVAFENVRDRKTTWYRMRQRGLLGEALAVFPDDPAEAAANVRALLGDPQRRAAMGAAGRSRMGPPGGARRIAERVAALAGAAR